MKKQLIGALVGGLLLFIWQFLSWAMLNLHGSEQQYTASQDSILTVLSENLAEEGTYFMPNVPPGTSPEEQQATMESNIGKPWAVITYHKELKNNMGMNMFRGFVVNVLAVFLLCWLLLKIPNIDMKTTLLASLAVGVIGWLVNNYINAIWFETDSMMHLVDSVVSWGLVGAWLGWYFNR